MAHNFRKGATVEISSEDDGFRGTWFAGTVIGKSKNDKLLVEYHTLHEDGGGAKKLREELDLVQLRPLPPPEPPRSGGFMVSEEVDAFYNDGWWEGVIMEVLKRGRYSVYFRTSRDQMVFKESQIRLHREWVDGNWVPPFEIEAPIEKKSPPRKVNPCKIVQGHFYQGALVEVSSDEDGFAGAWFAATVVEILGQGKYLIEYKNLRNDDDTEFLREEVDSQHIRPNPPEVADVDCFRLFEEVDALYNDGWWLGIISKVLKGQRYKVYFRGTNTEEEYSHSELRLHQDWVDGKWVVLSEGLKL